MRSSKAPPGPPPGPCVPPGPDPRLADIHAVVEGHGNEIESLRKKLVELRCRLDHLARFSQRPEGRSTGALSESDALHSRDRRE
jgi:hypothetical protein